MSYWAFEVRSFYKVNTISVINCVNFNFKNKNFPLIQFENFISMTLRKQKISQSKKIKSDYLILYAQRNHQFPDKDIKLRHTPHPNFENKHFSFNHVRIDILFILQLYFIIKKPFLPKMYSFFLFKAGNNFFICYLSLRFSFFSHLSFSFIYLIVNTSILSISLEYFH